MSEAKTVRAIFDDIGKKISAVRVDVRDRSPATEQTLLGLDMLESQINDVRKYVERGEHPGKEPRSVGGSMIVDRQEWESLVKAREQLAEIHGAMSLADPHSMAIIPKAEFVGLKAENERLQKRNDQMAGTAQDGINERDLLRRERDKALAERDQLQRRIDDDGGDLICVPRADHDTFRKNWDDLRDECGKLHGSIKRLTVENNELRQARADMEESRGQIRATLNKTITRMTAEKNERCEEIEHLKRELVRARAIAPVPNEPTKTAWGIVDAVQDAPENLVVGAATGARSRKVLANIIDDIHERLERLEARA